MADAKITVGMTPKEFDLVRRALVSERDRAFATATDSHTDAKIRRDERQLSVELNDIIQKLQ